MKNMKMKKMRRENHNSWLNLIFHEFQTEKSCFTPWKIQRKRWECPAMPFPQWVDAAVDSAISSRKRRSPVESSEEGFNGDSMVFHTGFSGDLMAFIWA